MLIHEWVEKWGVPQEALYDFYAVVGVSSSAKNASCGLERSVLQQVQLEASTLGARLWRNNVGAMRTAGGGYMRFGLANTSAEISKIIKSSDLIGIKPIKIIESHVGKTVGQFLCREVKRPGWRFNSKSEREQAQLRWIQLVASLGGDAAFTNATGSIK